MVGPGARPVKKLQAAPQAVRRFDHVLLEVFQAKQSGARAGRKEAARLDERDRELIQVFVFLPTLIIAVVFPGENEFGRIQDDGVPFFAVEAHLPCVSKPLIKK